MMNKLAGFFVGLVGLALAVSSNGALAATECNGVISGTIVDGVVVNAGDFCLLGGAHISGGVRVNQGGILIACASTIEGGIVANGAANLLIGAGKDEEGPPVNTFCPGNVINGAVQISNTGPGVLSPAPSIALERNAINGAVHLTGNQGPIVVSTEVNPVVSARCRKLKVRCIQGVDDKRAVVDALSKELGIPHSAMAFVGNDVNDLPALTCVGLPIVVADAHPDVHGHAQLQTQRPGGHGAVRELCDLIARSHQPQAGS